MAQKAQNRCKRRPYNKNCRGAEVLVPAVPPFHQGVDLEGRVLTIRTIEGMLPHEN